jgi:hypothetical protein
MTLISKGKKFFTSPISQTSNQTSKSSLIFWLTLSLTISAVYGFLAWEKAFSSDYVIQDDARQHIFWMQRFSEPELFPHDLIADYFQSVAPAGYTAFYQLMAMVGISPILLHKILPMFLGLISTVYGFYLCLEIFPVPLAAFFSTLFLNQSLWMQDGFISATPKAFIYPWFLPLLYYLVRQHLLGTSISLLLLGLFYPQGVLIAAVIFILRWVQIPPNQKPTQKPGFFCGYQELFVKCLKETRFLVSRFLGNPQKPGFFRGYQQLSVKSQKETRFLNPRFLNPRFLNPRFFVSRFLADRFHVICIVLAFFILAYYGLSASEFGPTIARSQAEILPEFLANGRSKFFIDDNWDFWFHGRSGMGLATILTPVFMAIAFLLPVLLRFYDHFPLSQEIKPKVMILPQLVISSFTLFFAAHMLLFKLHLPSRYTQHTLRIVLAISAAIALTLIIDSLWSWAINQPGKRLFLFPIIMILFTGLIFYPQLTMSNFPWTYYQVGENPELYQFFQQQPKDSLIASLSEEANNLPSFAQRSILTGREYAVPYHWGYYQQFRQRTLDLIQSQYSPNLADVQGLIEKYNIDFWLVERGAFTPGYLAPNSWLNQYEETTKAIAQLSAGISPAIVQYLDRCSVFESNGLVVLSGQCLSKIPM